MGSIGIATAHDSAGRECFHHGVVQQVHATYLRIESSADPLWSVVVQERVTGGEYGMDVVNDLEGCHAVTLAKRKLAMGAGEPDAAVTVSEYDRLALGGRLADILRHRALLDVDVVGTTEGRLAVLDLNPRFGGGYPFSHVAGARVPDAIIAWPRGERPPAEWLAVQAGVHGAKDIVPVVLSPGCA